LRQAAANGARSFLLPPIEPLLIASPAALLCLTLCAALLYLVLLRYARAPPVIGALCLLAAVTFQLGSLVLVLLTALLLRPNRVRSYLLCAGIGGLGGAIFWTVHTGIAANTIVSLHLMRSLTEYSLSYPWNAFVYLRQELPLTSLTVTAVALSALGSRSASRENRRIRILLMLMTMNVVLLGVLNLPLRSRYFLVFWPVILVLVTHGLGIVFGPISVPSQSPWVVLRRLSAAVLLLGLAVEHHGYGRANPVVTGQPTDHVIAVPRVNAALWSEPLSSIPSGAVVISNDELACVYQVGRIDYWLVTAAADLDQYAVPVNGGRRGLYGNGQVISSVDDLFETAAGATGERPWALVLFDTGRFEFEPFRQMAIEIAQRTTTAIIKEAPGIVVLLWR
jgi:hypothetical protein